MKPSLKRPDAVMRHHSRQSGFTLIEVLVSLLILMIVSGAVFEQIDQMQKRSASEAVKLDQAQQARDFLDQTVRDLHMSGYPSPSMYTPPPPPNNIPNNMVANGLISVSPTQLVFEGDVNNDGNVYSVNIGYVAADPNDSSCPCVRRNAVLKLNEDSLYQPLSDPTQGYTEATNVFPPGTGAGQSGENLFAYYDQNGVPVAIGNGTNIETPAANPGASGPAGQTGQDIINSIKTIKVNLSLLGRDAGTGGQDRTSLSATIKVN